VIDEILRATPVEKSGSNSVSTVTELRLANVSLRYACREELALHDISITMKRGTVTGIVGPTGSGKSTIANMIIGLYPPSSGSIFVDGVNLKNIDVVQWRRKIGYVAQDIFLFNASIRENIALWNESITQADIEWVARLAQLDEFIGTLPEAYDTLVGDRGLKLSGGQCQRVAIARALLFRPDILVFDEATSALDNLTEKAVYEAISALRKEAIVIAVAHRLSTIRDADQIVVLCAGRIAEVGTHYSLLREGGPYSKLYDADTLQAARLP
jgi:ATP-binding cassette subfamily B protein/subfamily B ATP-binding cassette protein MsbA